MATETSTAADSNRETVDRSASLRYGATVMTVGFVALSAFGLPMHYLGGFHVDQVRHLGPPYVILGLFVGGAALGFVGLRSPASED